MKKIKLSKKSQVRDRLLRNLLSSLILFEEVKTTTAKAKVLKAKASSFISKIKSDNTVNTKRYIASELYGGAKDKAWDYRDKLEVVKSYKLAGRLGDNAEVSIVKIIVKEESKPTKEKPTKVEKDDGA